MEKLKPSNNIEEILYSAIENIDILIKYLIKKKYN